MPLAEKLAASGVRALLNDRRNTGASVSLLVADDVERAVRADDLSELSPQVEATLLTSPPTALLL